MSNLLLIFGLCCQHMKLNLLICSILSVSVDSRRVKRLASLSFLFCLFHPPFFEFWVCTIKNWEKAWCCFIKGSSVSYASKLFRSLSCSCCPSLAPSPSHARGTRWCMCGGCTHRGSGAAVCAWSPQRRRSLTLVAQVGVGSRPRKWSCWCSIVEVRTWGWPRCESNFSEKSSVLDFVLVTLFLLSDGFCSNQSFCSDWWLEHSSSCEQDQL